MEIAYVYILECSDGSLYTGWTTNIDRRLSEHSKGKRGAKYTRTRLPVILRYTEPCTSKRHAMQREYAIKQLSRAQKLELIANFS
jgi:putative endonuclease